MNADERPVIHALAAYPTRADEPERWTEPVIVSLDVAAELQSKGYVVLIDPQDERDLAMYERLTRAVEQQRGRKWFEAI